MKKFLSIALVLVMIFSLASCSLFSNDKDDDKKEKITTEDLGKNAEDMGYALANDPTSSTEINKVYQETEWLLTAAKEHLVDQSDEYLDSIYYEGFAEKIKALADFELSTDMVKYAAQYEGFTPDDGIVIMECDSEANAEAIATIILTEVYSENVGVIANGKFVIVSNSEAISNAVLNGAPTIEDLGGLTAEELYNNEYNKISQATSIKTVTNQTISIDMSEFGYPNQITTQTIGNVLVGDDQYGFIQSTVNGNQEYWYIDGIYYMSYAQGNLKGELDLEKYAQQLGYENAKQGFINVPSDWFKGVELKNVDDNYFMVITVSGKKYTEVVGNAIGDMYEAQGFEIEVSDVSYRVYLDENGTINNIIADYEIYMSMQGVTIVADVYQVTEVSDVNSATIKEIPNPETFVETDFEAILGLN